MPLDPFTHTFKFRIGEKEILGECEFDIDGKLSYKIESSSVPLPAQTMKVFQEFMDLMYKIYYSNGGTTPGIQNIQVKKKEM